MNCFIEYNNGLIVPYTNNYIKTNINKVYYQNDNQYGFFYNGKFFINNIIYDFKINPFNFNIIVNKTNKINLNNNQNTLTYNIGYTFNNEKYILNIGEEILFIANKDNAEKIIKIG